MSMLGIAVDFEQPRALYQKVMNDTDREHLVYNFSVHLKGVKTPAIRDRWRAYLPHLLSSCRS